MNLNDITWRYDIAPDEIALSLDTDHKTIMGYVEYGGWNTITYVKVKRDQLPPYFFRDFGADKYLYYEDPEEIIYNKDYVPPRSSEDEEVPPPQETVSKKEYDELKDKLNSIEELLKQLLAQKGA